MRDVNMTLLIHCADLLTYLLSELVLYQLQFWFYFIT